MWPSLRATPHTEATPQPLRRPTSASSLRCGASASADGPRPPPRPRPPRERQSLPHNGPGGCVSCGWLLPVLGRRPGPRGGDPRAGPATTAARHGRSPGERRADRSSRGSNRLPLRRDCSSGRGWGPRGWFAFHPEPGVTPGPRPPMASGAGRPPRAESGSWARPGATGRVAGTWAAGAGRADPSLVVQLATNDYGSKSTGRWTAFLLGGLLPWCLQAGSRGIAARRPWCASAAGTIRQPSNPPPPVTLPASYDEGRASRPATPVAGRARYGRFSRPILPGRPQPRFPKGRPTFRGPGDPLPPRTTGATRSSASAILASL